MIRCVSKRDAVQDFNMWGAGWMVVAVIGLGLEREKEEERWGRKEGVRIKKGREGRS